MSIIPASNLDSSDLALLGNNLANTHSPDRRLRRRRAQLRAVNRSLSLLGEQVRQLHRPAHKPIRLALPQPA